MKYLIVLCVFLVGCSTYVPVTQKFPEPPKSGMIRCPELNLVSEDETKLSGVLEVVVSNYSLYHECQAKTDLWIEWYERQKQIHENVK
jgi:hypothetical protein